MSPGSSPAPHSASTLHVRHTTKLLHMEDRRSHFRLAQLGCRGRGMPRLEAWQQGRVNRGAGKWPQIGQPAKSHWPRFNIPEVAGESRNHRLQKKQSLKENCLSQPEIYESAVTVKGGGSDCKTTPGYCTDWLTPWCSCTPNSCVRNEKSLWTWVATTMLAEVCRQEAGRGGSSLGRAAPTSG